MVVFEGARRALQFGDQKINLHVAGRERRPHAARPSPGSADLCFAVAEPIEVVAARLSKAAIAIELGPVPRTGARGPVQSIYLRDPDGNLVELAAYASCPEPAGAADGVRLEVLDVEPRGAREEIGAALLAHNIAVNGPTGVMPLCVLLRDRDGTVLGGLIGRTSWSWLFVELLHLPARLRGQGLGRQILERAEAEALRRGCHGVWLDTFSGDAAAFYRANGYRLFGALPEYPSGHRRRFFAKQLASTSVGSD